MYNGYQPDLLAGFDVATGEEGNLWKAIVLMLIENAHGQYVWLARMIEETTYIAVVVGVDAMPVVQIKVVAVIGPPICLMGRQYFARVTGHKSALGHIDQGTNAPALCRLLALDNLQRNPNAILHDAILAGQLQKERARGRDITE